MPEQQETKRTGNCKHPKMGDTWPRKTIKKNNNRVKAWNDLKIFR